ncbi:PE-PPE domain-containing protein [Mycolicibacterium aurum]|uniref:PE-PPE domain-containing protein n=1 Tax=Mycolicibacterium aurum TaxID=1791 RepID=A0A3S4T7K1_MYCAU|nr:PE-PPE domain-containing protein [Mycolicibacterium aurum]VEG52746.1 PE-PPE domain-containing protein [Mycolicibacterium aurum]
MAVAAMPLAALPLTLGITTPSAAAAALIGDDAATVLTHGPTPWAMADNLSGALCAEPKVCREVSYQWIISLGETEVGVDTNVETLDYAIKNLTADGAGDKKIVYAFSGGARVASVWLQDHADDVDAPDADDLTLVLIGNGGRKYGGVNGWWYGDTLLTPTDTQYSVVDVAREYDPIADFPDDPFNVVALANALAAFYYVHLDYSDVDLDDGGNYVWTEGNTTYVFVPTENLPLLQGLRDLGLDSLADRWEGSLRDIIDQAYDRDYLEGVEPQGGLSDDVGTAEITEVSSLRTSLSTSEAVGADAPSADGVPSDVEPDPSTVDEAESSDTLGDTEADDDAAAAEGMATEVADPHEESVDDSELVDTPRSAVKDRTVETGADDAESSAETGDAPDAAPSADSASESTSSTASDED